MPAIDLTAAERDAHEATGRDPRARILTATIACLARFGVTKTTLDDVAQEAGCARATIYRYFPGKRALVLAAADREVDALITRTIAAGEQAETLEDAITEMTTTATRELDGHRALQLALAHEPELVLPHLSFEGGDHLLVEAGRRFGPALERFLPRERAERVAEWCARLVLTQLRPDSAMVDMTDVVAVRRLVHQFVMPGLEATAPETDAPSRR
jgi:AcrR family transcriptional regulator